MTPPALSGIIYELRDPALLVEPEGTVVAANPSASRLLRRPSAELLGKPLTAFTSDDPDNLTRYLRQCARNCEGIRGDLNIQPLNEQPVSCITSGGLVHHAEEQPRLVWLRFLPQGYSDERFIASNERLEELAEENRQHQQNELRWRATFENSPIGVMMADPSGRFFAANRAFRDMLGYTESELYRLTFIEIAHEEDREANMEMLRELMDGRRQNLQMEKRYRHKDGSLVWVRINIAIVPGIGGAAPFWFGVVEDINQRKHVEEELRLQIEVLQNIPAVAWTVTLDGRCDFINRFFLDATGMSREYIQSHPDQWNKTGNDPPPLFSGLPPQDCERVTKLFWNGIRTGQGWAFEAQHFHAPEGNYHWYFDRGVPLRDSQGRIIRFVGTCSDIEPLKQTQENLRESETRLQAFFENSPNLIFLKDREGRYLYVNRELKRVHRITEEQIKGKRDDEVFSAEQAAAFQASDRRVFEAGAPMEFEEVAHQEDGQHTSIVQKFPLFNAKSEIYAIGGIVTDITARKQTEKELLNLRDELTAELTAMTRLHEFATRLLGITDFQPLLEEVLDAVIALQNADFGNIQVYNSETRTLEIAAQRGFHQEFLEHFKSVNDPGAACGRAMKLRERVIIEDVEADSEYAPHRHVAASAGFRAVQSTPLSSRSGEFLGMLSTHFRQSHRPSPRDLRFTDLYARHAAEFIERKRLEAARRQVEEQYRHVVEAANDSIITIGESNDILFVNPATTKIFGYSSEELIGKPLTMLIPERLREQHSSGFNRYLRTGERHMSWKCTEMIGLRKNGEEFPLALSFGEVIKNGERLFTGFASDITDRKQAEEIRTAQIRQAAARAEVSVAFGKEGNLSDILSECAETIVLHLDAAFAGIWTLNEVGGMLELQASAGMHADHVGMPARIPLDKLEIGVSTLERTQPLSTQVLNDPRIFGLEWEQKEAIAGFSGSPMIVYDRTVGVLAVFFRKPAPTGTSEALASAADLIAQGIVRKVGEEKLRASERSLRELTETIPQMLWSAEPNGAIDYCNQRALGYTGLSAEEVRGAGWMRAVHDADVDKLRQAWAAAVSTGKPFQQEFRCLRAADRQYRWCISSALPLCDQKGCVIKWFGSVVDLHDWKEAQQVLQMTQAELARVSRLTTMGELAASIAHEINQPLAAINNNASACLRLLADRNLQPEILHGALKEIVADGTRASAVIARIRAFISKAPSEKNEINLNEVIQEVLALARHELHENRVLLELRLTDAPLFVLGDRVQLQQVFLNLIMNGIEAMSTVTDRPRSLCVESQIDESGNVLASVADSGPGLASEPDSLFTPFFTTKEKGMGMGLCISRSLVEGHGGTLWARPNSPRGAAFYVTLPALIGLS